MTPEEIRSYIEHLTVMQNAYAGRATTQVTVAEAMAAAAEAFTAYPVSGDATTIWVAQECQP